MTIFDASASFLSLPAAGRLKKRRPKKRIKAIIGLLFGTNTRKADEILSDFSEGNDYPLFLPPKTVSAVRLYGDEAFFDASASFLSLPDSVRQEF